MFKIRFNKMLLSDFLRYTQNTESWLRDAIIYNLAASSSFFI